MIRLLVAASLALVVLLGCGTPRPAPSQIETAGELVSSSASEGQSLYSLADGTSWVRPNDQFRVLYDMPGTRTLFVSGTDGQGTFVALVGSQDGLPADCPFAVRYGGREWGDAIESQGIMWRKAPELDSAIPTPASGADYPDNAILCLDSEGSVVRLIVATPPSGEPQPAGSAQAHGERN